MTAFTAAGADTGFLSRGGDFSTSDLKEGSFFQQHPKHAHSVYMFTSID